MTKCGNSYFLHIHVMTLQITNIEKISGIKKKKGKKRDELTSIKRSLHRHICYIKYLVRVRGHNDKLSQDEHVSHTLIKLKMAQWKRLFSSLPFMAWLTMVQQSITLVWAFAPGFSPVSWIFCCRNVKIWWFCSELAVPEMFLCSWLLLRRCMVCAAAYEILTMHTKKLFTLNIFWVVKHKTHRISALVLVPGSQQSQSWDNGPCSFFSQPSIQYWAAIIQGSLSEIISQSVTQLIVSASKKTDLC